MILLRLLSPSVSPSEYSVRYYNLLGDERLKLLRGAIVSVFLKKLAKNSIVIYILRWKQVHTRIGNVVTCSKREGCGGKVVLKSKEFSINVWEFLKISLFGSSYTSSLTSYVRSDTLVTSPGFGLIPNFEKADWLFGDKHFIFGSLMAYKMTKW